MVLATVWSTIRSVRFIVRLIQLFRLFGTGLMDGTSEDSIRFQLCQSKLQLAPASNITDYLIDAKTDQCHQIASRGPCKPNMIFIEQPGNRTYGICDCNHFERHPLIYHEQSDQCYYIFQQGHCEQGYWLTLNQTNNRPVCELNPCQSKGKNSQFVLLNGRCAVLEEKDEECEESQIVTFQKYKILPICGNPNGTDSSGAINQNRTFSCPPGSLRALSGTCRGNWDW